MQQSLFNLNDVKVGIQRKSEKSRSGAKKTNSLTFARLGKADDTVAEVVGDIQMGQSIHYTSAGEWSMHNLLAHILKQTGPAHVWIATWSVSENSVRRILDMLKADKMLSLSCVFDWRVKLRRPEAYELTRFNISDIRLTTCHAKVTAILNDDWQVAVVGSANYTNNPRIEAGVIACDTTAAEFHKNWMEQELIKADPFETAKKRKK